MPSISRIRFTNVIYEGGEKRYNDEIFQFDGHNAAIILENGGGKTVFVQTALQAVLPHIQLGERKIKNTLSLEGGACHIAVEWIINEKPRRYAVTAVTLFGTEKGIDSYKYAYEYPDGDEGSIEGIPFSKKTGDGNERACSRLEIHEYYRQMEKRSMNARLFETIKEYQEYIEQSYQIISSEWSSIARINSAEGDVDRFFEGCKTTSQLVDQLLIPVVEEAISASEGDNFADIFEKNRERFKKHKQLQKTINQSKMLLAELDGYVKSFKEYNEMESGLGRRKVHMKSIYSFTLEEEKEIKTQIEQNETRKSEIETNEKDNLRKQASYEIALCMKKMESSRLEYEKIVKRLQAEMDALERGRTRLCNLEIASARQQLKEASESVQYQRQQLENIDEKKDMQIIRTRLRANSEGLCGYFENEIGKLKTALKLKTQKIEKELKTLTELKKTAEELEKQIKGLLKEESSLAEGIRLLQNDMGDIKKEILGNFMQEKIEEEHPKWIKRLGEIEKEKEFYSKIKNSASIKKEELSKEILESRDKISSLSKEAAVKYEQISRIKEEQGVLLERLRASNGEWQYYTSLYDKQQSIIAFLEGRVEKTLAQREENLDVERRARRLQDDYGLQENFAADPLAKELVLEWSEQFKYLETAGRFMERASKVLGKDCTGLFEVCPIWPMTFVTSTEETGKLLEKLERISDEMTYPAAVISSDEAKEIANGKAMGLPSLVFPKHWKENMSEEGFEKWKAGIEETAQMAKLERQQKEEELSRWRSLLDETMSFFFKNPYEEYVRIEKDESVAQEGIRTESEKLQRLESDLPGAIEEIEESDKKLEEIEFESINLGFKCKRANEYILKKQYADKSGIKLNEIAGAMAKKAFEASKLKDETERQAGLIADQDREKASLEWTLNGLEIDRLYKEVMNNTPRHDGRSREVLEVERKNLNDEMDERQKGRRELQEKLDEALKGEGRAEKNLSTKLKKAEGIKIDEKFECHADCERQIDMLIEKNGLAEAKLKVANYEFEKARAAYEKDENRHEVKLEDFKKLYDKLEEFSMPLGEVKLELDAERKAIEAAQKQVNKMLERLSAERLDIERAIQRLEGCDKTYRYLSSDVALKELSSDRACEYPYKRLKFIDEEEDGLSSASKMLREKEIELERKKNLFIDKCNKEIQDVKLREIAVFGIQKRQDYAEVMEWHTKLNERIQRTVEIAQSGIREHDRDIQQLIHYVHNHLKKLASEIESIPKKTRVRMDTGFKEIYKFDVPQWSEQDGKEELRRHMEWMSEKLEGEEYKDENGATDRAKSRAAVEKWLQPKQLLKIVMKGRGINVKCRKVTNDNKVLGALFSWETSNEWSGGEKWSKNMALFLGILNYVAEKRQHVVPAGKRTRAVIMDNPFGKASSEHVLNPVFFVAEQLGFQIIALTAHAEGKFIRDYFPVVYSCRLRPVKGINASVFSKEKEIRYAYLKDNYPDSLERMYRHEQLEIGDQ